MLSDPASHGGDQEDSFDVVAPSLPGFGFSDHPTQRGMQVLKVADMWANLMTENLDYPRFAAVGGDIGAGVTSRLGFAHPDKLTGIHLTSITRPTPYLGPGSRPLNKAEAAHSAQREKWQRDEGGYAHIQGTKPQTLAYAMMDSPVGTAAWITEKYKSWSDLKDDDIESVYSKDTLLTNIMVYITTGTFNTASWIYYGRRKEGGRILSPSGRRVAIPTGCAVFPKELLAWPPQSYVNRVYNVTHWTEFPRGGHFAAMEQPEMLVDDIRKFCRSLRQRGAGYFSKEDS